MFLWESLLTPDWLPQMMRWLKAAYGEAKSLLEKRSYSDKGLKDGTFHSPNILCLFSWLEALDSAIRCPEQESVWFTQKQVLIQPCMVTNQQGRPNGVNIVERYPGEVAAMGGNQTKSSQFVSYVVPIQICKIWICICMYVWHEIDMKIEAKSSIGKKDWQRGKCEKESVDGYGMVVGGTLKSIKHRLVWKHYVCNTVSCTMNIHDGKQFM